MDQKCIDLEWVREILAELEHGLPEIDLDNMDKGTELEQLDFCNILNDDVLNKGYAQRIFDFYKDNIETLSRRDSSISRADTHNLILEGIKNSIELASKIESERVRVINENVEKMLNNNLVKAKIYETLTSAQIALKSLKLKVYESCTTFAIEKDKLAHTKKMDDLQFEHTKQLSEKKFCLEEMISHAQVESMRADYELKKTQAISFIFNQRAKLVDTLFNTLTIGVTQELMHILKEPNVMLGGLSPKEKFEEAWVFDEVFINNLTDIQWEGLCKPKKCLCEFCEE